MTAASDPANRQEPAPPSQPVPVRGERALTPERVGGTEAAFTRRARRGPVGLGGSRPLQGQPGYLPEVLPHRSSVRDDEDERHHRRVPILLRLRRGLCLRVHERAGMGSVRRHNPCLSVLIDNASTSTDFNSRPHADRASQSVCGLGRGLGAAAVHGWS